MRYFPVILLLLLMSFVKAGACSWKGAWCLEAEGDHAYEWSQIEKYHSSNKNQGFRYWFKGYDNKNPAGFSKYFEVNCYGKTVTTLQGNPIPDPDAVHSFLPDKPNKRYFEPGSFEDKGCQELQRVKTEAKNSTQNGFFIFIGLLVTWYLYLKWKAASNKNTQASKA